MMFFKKLVSHFWEIKLKKYHSKLNGPLFVNLEYGKKVLHAKHANYSFQKLHKVLSSALQHIYAELNEVSIVLNLGLGAGSTVHILREELGHSGDIISVEHDPVIVKIAQEEFDIDRFPNHKIIVEDAMNSILAFDHNSFDLIICDLFRDREVPEKFKTKHFFSELLNNLRESGFIIFNYVDDKKNRPFFMDFITSFSTECSYEILSPVKENKVLIVRKNSVKDLSINHE